MKVIDVPWTLLAHGPAAHHDGDVPAFANSMWTFTADSVSWFERRGV
jgi:hypothetical protein